MSLLLSHDKNLVIGNGRTWFLYSKRRLLTQHIQESLQVTPGPFPNFGRGMGTRLLLIYPKISDLNFVNLHPTWVWQRWRLHVWLSGCWPHQGSYLGKKEKGHQMKSIHGNKETAHCSPGLQMTPTSSLCRQLWTPHPLNWHWSNTSCWNVQSTSSIQMGPWRCGRQ